MLETQKALLKCPFCNAKPNRVETSARYVLYEYGCGTAMSDTGEEYKVQLGGNCLLKFAIRVSALEEVVMGMTK